MTKPVRITLILVALLFQGIAGATTLTFDDLTTNGLGIGTVTTPYDGLDLTCLGVPCSIINAATFTAHQGSNGYQGATISAPNVLFTTADVTITLDGGGEFAFDSAYITGVWENALTIAVVGKNGSTTVDSTSFVLGTAGVPTFFTFDWTGVTSVVFTASGGSPGPFSANTTSPNFAIDNLTYETPVPLPASAWLLLSALGGLGAVTRGRRASS